MHATRVTRRWLARVGRAYAVVGASALSPLTAGGQSPSPFDGPRRTELARDVVNVPLARGDDGFYYADVRLNGRPFRFTVETGAGFFAISAAAARAAGLTVDTTEVTPGYRAAVARVDSLAVGGATFHGLTARVMPAFGEGAFDGLIGISVLRDLLATLDLGGSTLRLERGALPAPNGCDVLPFAGEDRGRRVDLVIDVAGVATPAVIDTRSSFWLIAPDSLVPRLQLAAAPQFVSLAAGPSMGTFELRGARTRGDLRIGPIAFERPALVLRNRPGVVIGVPLLEQLVLTIDQGTRRVRITPRGAARVVMPPQRWETQTAAAPAAGAPAASETSSGSTRRVAAGGGPPSGTWTMGFGLVPQDGGLRIAVVFPGSSAEKAGVKAGDQVVEFDGTPAASMNASVTRAAAARGQPVKLVLLRDGARVELTVSLFQVP